MKTLITILFLSFLSSPSWSVPYDDLVERDGVYYINDKGERITLSELPEYNDCIYLKVSYRDGYTRQF